MRYLLLGSVVAARKFHIKPVDCCLMLYWLLSSHLFLFGSILGMNLFGGKFCTLKTDDERQCNCSQVLAGLCECSRKNFDSLLWAIVTVFQVCFRIKKTSWKHAMFLFMPTFRLLAIGSYSKVNFWELLWRFVEPDDLSVDQLTVSKHWRLRAETIVKLVVFSDPKTSWNTMKTPSLLRAWPQTAKTL